jgi:hypothetical protein
VTCGVWRYVRTMGLFVVAWHLASRWVDLPLLLPSPVTVGREFVRLALSGEAWAELWVSAGRLAAGYGLALAVGVGGGVLVATVPLLRAAARVPVEVLRPISGIAWIPVALYALGPGDGVPVFIIFYAAVFPILLIANSYGTTEPNYQGPLGSGAGLELPARQKSPFFPEGIYMHRNFWLAHANLVKSQPKAVVAFLVAFEQAVRELRKWPVEEIAKLVFKFWELEPAQVKEIWGNDLNVQRGWSWLTEGDLRAVVEQSQYAKATRIITSDVDWPVVIANLRPIVPIVREAYERTGSQPGAAVFQQTNVADVRGRPVWELESWKGAR